MIVKLDWVVFQEKFLTRNRIFVKEYDDRWELYCSDSGFVIKTIVEKYADQPENMMFIERYFNNPNIVKVIDITETDLEVDDFPEEMVEVEDVDGFE